MAFADCLLLRARPSSSSSSSSSCLLRTGVDVLRWQWFQPHPWVPVVLDENHVPDLNHHGVVHVHQARSVTPADAIVVDLAARTLHPVLVEVEVV